MSNTKKEEEKEVQKEITKGLAALKCSVNYYGEDGNLENNIPRSLITSNYGVCNGCEYFFCIEREFKGTVALCDHNNNRAFYLKIVDPILKCSRYEKKGGMSISEMQLIATIINPDKKERVGLV